MKKVHPNRSNISAAVLRSFLFIGMILCSVTTYAAKNDSLAVYVFLSEKCPICQSITIELKELQDEFKGEPIQFQGYFPNEKMSNAASLAAFSEKYKINFPLAIDKGQKMRKTLHAQITPQVFVVNLTTHQILYSGKVDNSFESLGNRRTVVTQHYLKQALNQILNHQSPNPSQTKAVGCFII